MKKFLFVILALSLTACLSPSGDQPASRVTVTSEVTVTLPLPTATPVPTATATEIPFAALPPEEQAAQYLAGKVQDVSGLSFEQRKEFSIAYNELKEAARESRSVTRTDENGKITYLGSDGNFHDEKQTVDKYIPRVTDSEGYTHLFVNGEWVKVEDSQNIQYDNFETDFAWPNTEIVDTEALGERNKGLAGLTIPETALKMEDGNPRSMMPVIILSKEIGEINIPSFGDAGTLFVYPVYENDQYSTTRVIVTGNPGLFGDNLVARSSGDIYESTPFWQNLEENTLYYMIFSTDQKANFAASYINSDGAEVTTAYNGLVPSNLAGDALTGKIEDGEMALIMVRVFVKEAGK